MKETFDKGGPDPAWLDRFIRSSLEEDIGEGDHSSLSCIEEEAEGKVQLLIKDDSVIAGLELATGIFRHLDPEVRAEQRISNGERAKGGSIALEVEGRVRSLLAGERLVLNCMQRMSGIATLTASFVDRVKDLPVQINDTRKTTPGLRPLEKWAVRIGGGLNHRHGLYDMILLKDNHIDHAGGVENALRSALDYLEVNKLELPVEVEARGLEEVDRILRTAHVDRIMLDNFSFGDLEKAVARIDGVAITEASGGITLGTVRDYAECGVDRISVGALTHSYPSIDMSLKASGEKL
ncbi:MAG: carboxylating nicotinate-nucleotide diphosphorylase [Flavobacteriales bacterium]